MGPAETCFWEARTPGRQNPDAGGSQPRATRRRASPCGRQLRSETRFDIAKRSSEGKNRAGARHTLLSVSSADGVGVRVDRAGLGNSGLPHAHRRKAVVLACHDLVVVVCSTAKLSQPCNGLRRAARFPTQCFASVDFRWHTAWSTESFVGTVLRRRRLSSACPFADREFGQPAICRTRFSLPGQRSFGLSSVGIRTPCGMCAPRLEPRSGVSYGPPVLFSCTCACLTSVQLLAPFTGIP